MTDDIIKRASFGFDADFGDLSTVKPTGTPVKKTPKPKAAKPKTRTKTSRKAKPKPAVRKVQDDLADRLAKSQGFTSREATPSPAPVAPVLMKKRRRIQHAEPVDQLSIRGPVRVLNGFIDFCEENKLSYWEGMEQLVADAQISQ